MPQAIGAIIAAGITASTGVAVSATAAGVIGSVVVAGVAVGAQLLLAPKPDIPKPQDGKQTLKQSVPPVVYAYGRTRLSGSYVAYEMKGSTSHDVLAIHQGEIDGYENWYLNDDLIGFAAGDDGFVDGRYSPRYAGGSSTDVRLYWRKGLPTETAYAEMIAAFPGLWTADHRLDGIATCHLICTTPEDKVFPNRFPFGLPRPSVVGRWLKCWDPRDPAQSASVPSTYKWTENAIVQLLDFCCHAEGGYQRPVDRVFEPYAAFWLSAMDRCDEDVMLSNGATEKRWRASGHFTSETPRKSVVEALLGACDGFMTEMGDGGIVVYAGGYDEPDLVLTDAHVIDLDISKERHEDERVNELVVKFNSPDHDYNEVEVDPWADQAAIDAGAPLVRQETPAAWAPSFTQARRLGKIAFDRATCDVQGRLTSTLYGENLKGRRFFRLQIAEMASLRDVVCEILDLVDNSLQDGTWQVEFKTVRPARYAWSAIEEGRRPPIPDKTNDDERPVPPLPTLAVIRETIAGAMTARISASSPAVEAYANLTLVGRYRKVGDARYTAMTAPDEDLEVVSEPVADGSYEVQTAYKAGGGGQGEWSPPATIGVVSDNVAPTAPTNMQATGGAGTISFSARASKSANVRTMEFRIGTTAQAFAAATVVNIEGLPRASVTANQVVGPNNVARAAGIWRVWAENFNGSGVASGAPVYADATVT